MGRGRKPTAPAKPSKREDSEHSDVDSNCDEGDNDECAIKEEEPASNSGVPVSSKSCQKVMIVNKEIETIGWNNMEQVILLHPRTQQKALFLVDVRQKGSESFIFEIMTMEQETRSWFVDEGVISNGNVFITTPLDPLFLILPALMKSSQAMPLRDHLTETIKNTKIEKVFCSRLESSLEMENIAVKKVLGDIIAFKYSEDKTIEWLAQKVNKISKFLNQRGISGTEASVSANFAKSSDAVVQNKDGNIGEEYIRYACEIVGEYIDNELKKLLFERYKLPFVQPKALKRKSEGDGLDKDGQAKKIKTSIDGSVVVQPTEDYGSANSATTNSSTIKLKAKDKELQKAAKGSRSLLNFFAPKTK